MKSARSDYSRSEVIPERIRLTGYVQFLAADHETIATWVDQKQDRDGDVGLKTATTIAGAFPRKPINPTRTAGKIPLVKYVW